jgi:hypothetical protein
VTRQLQPPTLSSSESDDHTIQYRIATASSQTSYNNEFMTKSERARFERDYRRQPAAVRPPMNFNDVRKAAMLKQTLLT